MIYEVIHGGARSRHDSREYDSEHEAGTALDAKRAIVSYDCHCPS